MDSNNNTGLENSGYRNSNVKTMTTNEISIDQIFYEF